jgi:kynurenine formamidase
MKRILIAVLILSSTRLLGAGGEPSLWSIQRTLVSKKYVDLTHKFAPGIPHWPGFPDEAAKMENKYVKGVAQYPGWSLPALKYLYEEQKITASGHETTDTDNRYD